MLGWPYTTAFAAAARGSFSRFEIRRIADHQIEFSGVAEPGQHLQGDALRENEISILHNVIDRNSRCVRPPDKRVKNIF